MPVRLLEMNKVGKSENIHLAITRHSSSCSRIINRDEDGMQPTLVSKAFEQFRHQLRTFLNARIAAHLTRLNVPKFC